MNVVEYFQNNVVTEHELRLVSYTETFATVAIKPKGFDQLEMVFVIPRLVQIECKLLEAGLCDGGHG